jgi:CubicO group peptidase (beta-lactamase class C family)
VALGLGQQAGHRRARDGGGGRGRLRLDAAVTDYLPSFGGPTGRAITIRHLLQHLSGLPNPSDGAPNANSMPPFYGRSGDVGGLADAMGVCAGAPKGAPGASFAYNNCDYIVLGAILERVSGRTYAQLVRERLAKPLALRSVEAARRGRPGVAGYDEVGAGELPYNLATFGPGGAIVGTARDLLKFDAALLSRRAVSPASTAVMWAGEPKFGYAALGAWSFPAALRGCAGSVQLVERRGAIGGVQVRNILAPSLGRSLVVFANTGKLEFGEVWQGKGLSYDLLSAAFCEGAAPAK